MPRIRASVTANKNYTERAQVTISHFLGAMSVQRHTVPPFVRGDEPEVFALCFSTLPHAAADATFELVWRADTFVALFQPYCHCWTEIVWSICDFSQVVQDVKGLTPYRIADPVAAPRRPHARLDGPEGLSVGVATFESRVD